MKRLATCGLVAWGLCFGAWVSGQEDSDPPSDDRVEQILKQAGLTYTIDSDGDFKLEESMENGRTQLAWINSRTEKFGALEIRELWSIAMISDEPLSQEVANRLLEDNSKTKLGAWRVERMGDRYAAVFAVQIAANADEETLVFSLLAMVLTADKTEEALTSKDDY